jgi:hypothetical protein
MAIRPGCVAAVAAVLTGACSKSAGPTGPGPAQTGSLTVTITAPAGVSPRVTVSGPGGFSQQLRATQTLSGLSAGTYTVTAASDTVTNPVVSTLEEPSVTGAPATVTPDATANATVSYAPRGGSGELWVGNLAFPGIAVSYSATNLSGGPAATVTGPGSYVAFDAAGNLWSANVGDAVYEFTAAQLTATGNPTPAVTVSSDGTSLSYAQALGFDAAGDLWVVNPTNTVVEFTPTQIAQSGSPTPVVTLADDGSGSLSTPLSLAFDGSGNLWISNGGTGSNNTVVEFSASQLTHSGAPTPAVILSDDGHGSLAGPFGLAFDGSGNLWVTNGQDSSVVEFTPSQFGASGSPTPTVTISAKNGSLAFPTDLAFDASGDLWVSNAPFGAASVVEFGASQLLSAGSPTPIKALSGGSIVEPYSVAFDPPPASVFTAGQRAPVAKANRK